MTTPMHDGRQASTGRRRQRVQDAIATAVRDGTPLTASAIARAAGVDRTFLYRYRDLLQDVHLAGTQAVGRPQGSEPVVTSESLKADLANANARAARLASRVKHLEDHLSRQLGERAWRESGLAAAPDIAELQTTIEHLKQRNAELTQNLEERQAELDAARAANRDLTRALNQRG
ncbi:hypothetical protein [Streptomyces viridochromogenes]|uniref:hypothetical protein n=1 Tax=Streptomyces viridochromogenes TaxID=1938 RepID=UPI000B1273D5|nr:hypothetical protein [Streptomyces viridochromogenes]